MKNIPVSPRIALIKRSQKIRRIRIFVLFFVLFISVIIFLSYFSFHPKLQINNLKIEGNNVLSSNDLEKNIQNNLEGKYLGLFSKSNFIIYPNKKIFNNLKQDFQRIKTLEIKQVGLNNLVINLSEKEGSYLYCGSVLPEIKKDIGENCFFVNNDGFIFDNAPYYSGDIFFKYYMKIESEYAIGQSLLPKEDFHKIIRFIDEINLLGFTPCELYLDSNNVYNMYLKPKNKDYKSKIIFNKGNDLDIILENLSTAMSKDEFAKQINSKYDELLYIDLRFKNKVLYKFNNE